MKKFLVLILSVVAAFTATISLTACEAKVDKDGNVTITDGGDNGGSSGGNQGGESGGEQGETPTHTHVYTKKVTTDKYLKSAAACAAKAVYYYSCECGEKGSETFTHGETLPHTFDKQIVDELYLKSAATCTAKAVYYYSCECGEKGEQTFEYGELVKHYFGKDHFCVNCGYYTDDLIGTEISSLSLEVNGNEIKGKVPNAQTTFSFINDIEVADGASYVVCMDFDCSQVALRKIIALSSGDNVCYILVTNGNDMQLYTVTVRRRPIYTVAFNSNGGTSIDSQQVEEDNLAAKPAAPTKKGYEFSGFDYDFNKPIVKNSTINAKWQIITYKISYILDGGVNNTQNPTTYTVEDKIELKPATSGKLGYSFASWDNGGVIEKGSTGNKTFTANYTPITYKITYNCGIGKNNANNVTTYNIESDTIKLLDAYYINADFVEWQRGGVKVTEIPSGSYGDVTLTAVWNEYDVQLKLNDDGESYTVICLNTDKTDIEIKALTKNITSIGNYAFYYCPLTSVTISDSVTSVGEGAFKNCTSLTSVTIGGGVTSIGSEAFYYCSSLTSVTIPDSVTSIGDYAFIYCSSLTSVTIPDSVTSIGDDAFV